MLSVRSNRLPALVLPLLVIALVACGGSTQTTATAGASATPTTTAALIQATQPAPIATATTPGTPTPLANALPRVTTAATEAGRATGAATTAATANADTLTPLARTTANVGVVTNASTATTSASTARPTQVLGSAATSTTTSPTASAPTFVVTATITSATASVSTSGSAVTGTGAVGTPTPTTTPVPTNEARGATEQFLRTVLAKGDISGDLTPALKSQTGSDGYKLLNIQPPVKSFTIDSEQRDADGNSATVQATITTATGVVTRTFVMRKQGNTWLVDNVLG